MIRRAYRFIKDLPAVFDNKDKMVIQQKYRMCIIV